MNLSLAQARGFAIEPGSRVLQFASLGFDASVSEWSAALSSGARLVIPSQATQQDPARLGELVEREGVSHATLPPSLLTSTSPSSSRTP